MPVVPRVLAEVPPAECGQSSLRDPGDTLNWGAKCPTEEGPGGSVLLPGSAMVTLGGEGSLTGARGDRDEEGKAPLTGLRKREPQCLPGSSLLSHSSALALSDLLLLP